MRKHNIYLLLLNTGYSYIGESHPHPCFSSPALEETLMIRNRNRHHRRGGYTLVEVMVALGLSVLTMWILAEAFRIGLEMIGQARAQAQLMTQLSAVGNILHRDLVVAHPFLPDDNRPNRGLRLSDQRLDRLDDKGQGWKPPRGGFFRIISPSSTTVATDVEGLNIYSATNHALHFTAILPEEETALFQARVDFGSGPPVSYESRAAEIAYFLADTGAVTGPGGNRLYNLIRRQRLVAMEGNGIDRLMPITTPGADYTNYINWVAADLIAGGSVKGPYSLRELRHPDKRLQLSPVTIPTPPNSSGLPALVLPVTGPDYGADILLSNVLSFEIRVNWDPNPNFVLKSWEPPRPLAKGNTEYPYDNLGVNPGRNSPLLGVFDTWHDEPAWIGGPNPAFATLPLAIRVKGIQITIRVFDPKTRSVRQNTWRFAL